MAIEFRFADGRPDSLRDLAAELVRTKIDVFVTESVLAAREAKNATGTIPIVTAIHGDPVGAGLAASLTRPGGNVTGLSLLAPELSGKRLQLLKEIHPKATRVAIIWNADECRRLSLSRGESLGGSLPWAPDSGRRGARSFGSGHRFRDHSRRPAERLHDVTGRHAAGERDPHRRLCREGPSPRPLP